MHKGCPKTQRPPAANCARGAVAGVNLLDTEVGKHLGLGFIHGKQVVAG